MRGLGAVVILKKKNGVAMNHKIVIVDRFLVPDKNKKEYFEYKGVVYPFGSYQGEEGVLFNEENIGEQKVRGYTDKEDDVFVKLIKEKFKELGIEKSKGRGVK